MMHNQQLGRLKLHVNIPKKKNSKKEGSLYIDFLILRNTALESMCGAYCAVRNPVMNGNNCSCLWYCKR